MAARRHSRQESRRRRPTQGPPSGGRLQRACGSYLLTCNIPSHPPLTMRGNVPFSNSSVAARAPTVRGRSRPPMPHVSPGRITHRTAGGGRMSQQAWTPPSGEATFSTLSHGIGRQMPSISRPSFRSGRRVGFWLPSPALPHSDALRASLGRPRAGGVACHAPSAAPARMPAHRSSRLCREARMLRNQLQIVDLLLGGQTLGRTFWFRLKKFVGSYLFLISTSRG